jgi:hypothetical protein
MPVFTTVGTSAVIRVVSETRAIALNAFARIAVPAHQGLDQEDVLDLVAEL